MNVKIKQMRDVNEGKLATGSGSLSEATAVGQGCALVYPIGKVSQQGWWTTEDFPIGRVQHMFLWTVEHLKFEIFDRLRICWLD